MLRPLLLSITCGLSLLGQSPLTIGRQESSGKGDWKGALGALALSTPRAPGSEKTRVLLLPFINAEYKNTLYVGASNSGVGFGGGAHVLHHGPFTWDLELAVGENRRESRADTLAGMADRGLSLFAVTALRLKAGPLHGSFSLAAGLKDEAGLRSALSLGLGGRLAGRWSGGITAAATARDAKGMAFDFGITPGQAATRSALVAAGDPRLKPGEDRAWSPKGGLQEMALSAHLGYSVDAHWQCFGILRAAQLLGDAKASPLTRQADSLTVGVGTSYRF
jgi:outer membrane scaffolding protein for murein synthesis (MipA/OmpV family)